MCGLVGFVDLEGLTLGEDKLKKALKLLAHRGPDDEGLYQDGFCALGHRRLAIIDLAGGRQPLRDEETGQVIVFNGEIYNFPWLKKKLTEKGFSFRTRSDTEVILKAYQAFGPDCLKYLEGMFAFALWDPQKKELFFARDRLGKKPFYFRREGKQLAFASELKAILPEKTPQVSPLALDCFFSFGYIPSPLCVFETFEKLPPAHAGLFSSRGLKIFRYWDLRLAPQDQTLSQALEAFLALFEEAVRKRLLSEVPLGAFLSGGVDSPLVVGQMKELLDEPVLTNAIGFEGGADELPLARKFARYFGTDHREYKVKPEAAKILPKLVWHLDEPLADSSVIPTFYVCQMARQNVTVALSGDGGDESFAGYTFRYLPHLWESRLRAKIPLVVRSLLFGVLARVYPHAPWLPKPLRLKTIFGNLAVSDARAFYQDLVWLPPTLRAELYTPDFKKALCGFSPFELVYPLYEKVKELDPISRAQYVDLHFYLPEDVLVKVDRMSMAVALEVRSPLLDHRVVEFAATLPLKLKVRGRVGKILLREALKKFLPPEEISPKKIGFAVPEGKWLRGELRPLVERALADRKSFLWSYLHLKKIRELWRAHLDSRLDLGVFFWGLMCAHLWEKEYLRCA